MREKELALLSLDLQIPRVLSLRFLNENGIEIIAWGAGLGTVVQGSLVLIGWFHFSSKNFHGNCVPLARVRMLSIKQLRPVRGVYVEVAHWENTEWVWERTEPRKTVTEGVLMNSRNLSLLEDDVRIYGHQSPIIYYRKEGGVRVLNSAGLRIRKVLRSTQPAIQFLVPARGRQNEPRVKRVLIPLKDIFLLMMPGMRPFIIWSRGFRGEFRRIAG